MGKINYKSFRLAIILCVQVYFLFFLNQSAHAFSIAFKTVDTLAGYSITAKTDNAEYFFENDDEEYNLSLVEKMEFLFKTAFDEFGLKPQAARIFFTSNDEWTTAASNKLVINPESDYSLGAFMYYISGLKFPAWLCAGLELNWLENSGYDTYGVEFDKNIDIAKWAKTAESECLPGFGDAWFVPEFLSGELKENVSSVAYAFVKYLNENGELKNLIETYTHEFLNRQTYQMDNTIKEADAAAFKMWSKLSGADNEDGIASYKYLFSRDRNSAEDIVFINYGVHGTYSYCRPEKGNWKLGTVEQYYRVNEDSIAYVKDWFGYFDYIQPIEVMMITKFDDEYAGRAARRYSRPLIILTDCFERFNYSCLHEAVHALRYGTGEWQPLFGRYFEEGMARAFEYMYCKVNEEYRNLDLPRLEGIIEDLSGDEAYTEENLAWRKELYETYKTMTGLSFSANPPDVFTFLDINAAMYIKENYNGYLSKNPEYDWIKSDKYWFMQSNYYYTSGSFMRYVLRLGSEQDFRQFCVDVSSAKDIYGKDLDTLIREWLMFLGIDFINF
jgi:hypothetical protein